MPFELTYADDNNQFLYYNNAHQDPDTMFAKRVPPQSGSRMSTVHGSLPPARMKTLNGSSVLFATETRNMFVPLFQDLLKA